MADDVPSAETPAAGEGSPPAPARAGAVPPILPDPVPVQFTLTGRGRREPILIAFDNARLRRTALMLAALLVLVQVGLWAFEQLDQFLLGLLLALLLAISMEPLIRVLTARGMRRGAAVGLGMVLGLLAVIALVTAFGGAFFSQMAELATSLPGLAGRAVRWVNDTFGLTFDPNALARTLNQNTNQIAAMATDLAGGVVGIISSLASWVFQLAAIALFAFYFAADGPRMRQAIGRMLPHAQQRVFVTVWDTTVTKTGGYVASKGLLATLSTIFHAIVFSMLDVPFWLPMSLWVGITSQFLPVVGTYLGIALPVIATAFTAPWDALAIVVIATAYQQLENYILVPKISKRTMDIHPAVAFASVVVGVALFGWIGGLVAIPLTAAFVSTLSAYGHRHELIPELARIESGEAPD